MAYNALEESLRLLAGGGAPDVARLTRRVRHVPLAVDRHGDVAATMFLRRGVSGEPWIDVHTLEHVEGEWRTMGGGSGDNGEAVLLPRRSVQETGRLATAMGGGGTVRNPNRPMPWGKVWVRWVELRAAAEVHTLMVAGRAVPVAPHGAAVVVWQTSSPPSITALDGAGRRLGRVPTG